MDTIPVLNRDDGSGNNPSSVKSDNGSPKHENGRESPPPKCAICLGQCENKSFTDSCLHQFCFGCLLTWSKVKAECPLCKQNFRSIIHNVRSNHQYEEYMVEQRQVEEAVERIDLDSITVTNRRFRYRTTLTLPRSESLALQQLLLQYRRPLDEAVPPSPAPRRRSPSFRRTIYRHNLWARPLPDFTGRYRDATPQFYRFNYTQVQRLVPWLNRELAYLLNENAGHIAYVLSRILELLPQYHINSPEFRDEMRRYFGERTEHFLHELYCFASTPYDLTGYDRNVQYTTDRRVSTMVNEVDSSSDSSQDSDLVVVSSSLAGPSRAPAFPPQSLLLPPAAPVAIETVSHSDSNDDEVMLVGYIKPPAERTPEVVDLLGSDSDVLVTEPEPRPTVKLSLTRPRRPAPPSDSDSDYLPSVPSRPTTATPPGAPPTPRRRRFALSEATFSSQSTSSCSTTVSYTPTESSVFSDEERRRVRRKKRKTYAKLRTSAEREKSKRRKNRSRCERERKRSRSSDRSDRSRKWKSETRRGAKRSAETGGVERAGGSGLCEAGGSGQGGASGSGQGGASGSKPSTARGRGEAKRLRSVVNVVARPDQNYRDHERGIAAPDHSWRNPDVESSPAIYSNRDLSSAPADFLYRDTELSSAPPDNSYHDFSIGSAPPDYSYRDHDFSNTTDAENSYHGDYATEH